MTDDSATLRAMVSRAIKDAGDKCYGNGMSVKDACDVLASAAIAVCQSSWAKEKAELERQLAEADYIIDRFSTPPSQDDVISRRWWETALDRQTQRHASRPVTAKD